MGHKIQGKIFLYFTCDKCDHKIKFLAQAFFVLTLNIKI